MKTSWGIKLNIMNHEDNSEWVCKTIFHGVLGSPSLTLADMHLQREPNHKSPTKARMHSPKMLEML